MRNTTVVLILATLREQGTSPMTVPIHDPKLLVPVPVPDFPTRPTSTSPSPSPRTRTRTILNVPEYRSGCGSSHSDWWKTVMCKLLTVPGTSSSTSSPLDYQVLHTDHCVATHGTSDSVFRSVLGRPMIYGVCRGGWLSASVISVSFLFSDECSGRASPFDDCIMKPSRYLDTSHWRRLAHLVPATRW